MAFNLVKVFSDFLAKQAKKGSFDALISNLKFISACDGCVRCEFMVEERHSNPRGTLHGGVISALFDVTTQYALNTKDCAGVSVELAVTFIRPANVGEIVEIEAKLLKLGSNLSYAIANMWDKDSKKLIATGKQTMFVIEKKCAADTFLPLDVKAKF